MQFRAAIQLQFDFHRAIYNLGTVLVSLLVITTSSHTGWHDPILTYDSFPCDVTENR